MICCSNTRSVTFKLLRAMRILRLLTAKLRPWRRCWVIWRSRLEFVDGLKDERGELFSADPLLNVNAAVVPLSQASEMEKFAVLAVLMLDVVPVVTVLDWGVVWCPHWTNPVNT